MILFYVAFYNLLLFSQFPASESFTLKKKTNPLIKITSLAKDPKYLKRYNINLPEHKLKNNTFQSSNEANLTATIKSENDAEKKQL